MAKYKVLSTKKLEPSLVAKAKENNIEIIEQEFIAVRPIVSKGKRDEIMAWLMNSNIHHVAFTSVNAVEAVKNYWHDGTLPTIPNFNVFCISGRTKSALQSLISPEMITATADYGKELAREIIEHGVKEIVFFCGNRRRDELPALLSDAGIKVHEVVVYETTEIPAAITDEVCGILFFSPSAVQSFFSANQPKKDVVCFAVGTTTAAALQDCTDNRVVVSEATSQDSMLAAVRFYFENSNCQE